MGQSQNVLPKRWPFRKNDINCEKWMHMKTQEGNPLECLHYLCGLCYYFSWLLRPGLRALNLSLILPTVNKLEEAFPWITWNIWREKEETSWHWRHPVERWESWHPQTGVLSLNFENKLDRVLSVSSFPDHPLYAKWDGALWRAGAVSCQLYLRVLEWPLGLFCYGRAAW